MLYDPSTYVDGVPVKIAEKYRPPRKVMVSPLFSYHVNSEVLTTEYDVKAEEECIKRLQNLKAAKEKKKELSLIKIKNYKEEKERLKQQELEEKQKALEEEARAKLEKDIDEELEEEKDNSEEEEANPTSEEANCDEKIHHDASDQINTEETNTAVESKASKAEEVLNPLPISSSPNCNYGQNQCSFTSTNTFQPSYPTMLVPTQCSLETHHKNPSTKTSCNINFAEFEGDSSDPFDSVALKSINDMEELAKVLQMSNLKQKGYPTPNPTIGIDNQGVNYQQPGTSINGGYPYNYQFLNYQSNLPINTSLYNQISSYQAKPQPPQTSSVVPLPKSNTMYQNDSMAYSQWNRVPSNSNTTNIEPFPYKSYNYTPQPGLLNNVKPPLDNAVGSPFPKMPFNQLASSLPSNTIPNDNARLDTISKRPDLEDFYSRYYSNKKSPSNVQSADITPITLQQGSRTLSSSTSVPDLTTVEDSEVSNIVSNSQLEKASFKGSNNFITRPSSTGSYESMSKAFHYANKDSSLEINKRCLPDPFTELTEDAQSLVQGLAEMGFPRARVARAVQKLGTDHKKLLEVLLTLQNFQESGEDEYRAERAFYFFMGEVSKVSEFLVASKTLLGLGFEEEKVIEYLFKYQNDKDKCLEELIA